MRAGSALVVVAVLLGAPLCHAQSVLWSVRGVTFDSVRGRPLSGALVAIVGTGRNTISDSLGAFSFDSIAPGRHVFAMQHDSIDVLGFSGFSTRAVIDDARHSVVIAVPSFATLWRAACGERQAPADSGFIYGSIRDSAGRPAARAAVDLVALDPRQPASSKGPQRRLRSRVTTDATGGYSVCGVPMDVAVFVQAAADSLESDVVEMAPTGQRIRRQNMSLRRAGSVARGVLAGFITDSAGKPISGAELTIPELSRTAQTNERGQFRLGELPVGRHAVQGRRLGYAAVDTILDVTDGQPELLRLEMRRLVTLESVRVTERIVNPTFDENKRLGLGRFLEREEIARFDGLQLSGALRQFQGMNLIGRGSTAVVASTRKPPSLSSPGPCIAHVYVDNLLMNRGNPVPAFDVNTIAPDQVDAVEWYAGASRIPARYSELNSACGVLVIWTRAMRK